MDHIGNQNEVSNAWTYRLSFAQIACEEILFRLEFYLPQRLVEVARNLSETNLRMSK